MPALADEVFQFMSEEDGLFEESSAEEISEEVVDAPETEASEERFTESDYITRSDLDNLSRQINEQRVITEQFIPWFQQRFEDLQQSQQPKKEEPAPPSLEEEPLAAIYHEVGKVSGAINDIEKSRKENEERSQVEKYVTGIVSQVEEQERYVSDPNSGENHIPEYMEAARFLGEQIAKDLQEFYGLSGNDLIREHNRRLFAIYEKGIKGRERIPHKIYEMAVSRGFKSKVSDSVAKENFEKEVTQKRGGPPRIKTGGGVSVKSDDFDSLEDIVGREGDVADNSKFERFASQFDVGGSPNPSAVLQAIRKMATK